MFHRKLNLRLKLRLRIFPEWTLYRAILHLIIYHLNHHTNHHPSEARHVCIYIRMHCNGWSWLHQHMGKRFKWWDVLPLEVLADFLPDFVLSRKLVTRLQ
jgi:hypothetical protein